MDLGLQPASPLQAVLLPLSKVTTEQQLTERDLAFLKMHVHNWLCLLLSPTQFYKGKTLSYVARLLTVDLVCQHRGRRPVCRNRVVGMGNLTHSPAETECRCVTGLAIIRTLPLTQAILSLLRSFFELYRLESESPVFRV